MSRICCWHPVLTAHQSHTLRAFGQAMGLEIRVIACAADIAERLAQGWTANDPSIVPVEYLPERGWRRHIAQILREERDSIHIFGSPFERSKQNLALAKALWGKLEVYLISEPYSPLAIGYLNDGPKWKERLKALLRPQMYRLYGRAMRNRLGGVFAISPAAVKQYQTMGVVPRRVFPFGYFVPLPPPSGPSAVVADDPAPDGTATGAGSVPSELRVAYLGSFIRRKGIATLLEAFSHPEVRHSAATLTLFGSANPDIKPQSGPRVTFGGTLPFGNVHHVLSAYDLLVVPSLYDGWAVVVNEAIGAGVPVLVSDMVGAGQMVEDWGCGARFAAGNAQALARIIASLANDRPQLAQWRSRTPLLADKLQPDVAGSYMRDCIAAARGDTLPPAAPWYRQ